MRWRYGSGWWGHRTQPRPERLAVLNQGLGNLSEPPPLHTGGGGKHGSIWQNCVFRPSFERFFDPVRGQKNRTRKKTNSWERRFPGTFRTNVPLILPIFSVFSVGGGPKVPRNFVPGNFFFLILGGFSPSDLYSKKTSQIIVRGWGGQKSIWQLFPCQGCPKL